MPRRFSFADLAQQMVGGFLLAGPFVVTEEVWTLARNMSVYHSAVTFLIIVMIGYGALFKADVERDMEKESELAGVPVRLISLILVSYFSVGILVFVLNAPETFGASLITSFKTMSVASIFSLIGAATVDSIL